MEISFEAADLIMNFPNKIDEFCDCVKKISKFLCIEISDKLDSEHIDDSDSIYERFSFISEAATEFY